MCQHVIVNVPTRELLAGETYIFFYFNWQMAKTMFVNRYPPYLQPKRLTLLKPRSQGFSYLAPKSEGVGEERPWERG